MAAIGDMVLSIGKVVENVVKLKPGDPEALRELVTKIGERLGNRVSQAKEAVKASASGLSDSEAEKLATMVQAPGTFDYGKFLESMDTRGIINAYKTSRKYKVSQKQICEIR